MAPLADLKEKRLPAYKEGTSGEDYKHSSLSAASTRSRAKEVFNGTVKKLMDDDMKTRKEKGDTQGLGKSDLDNVTVEN